MWFCKMNPDGKIPQIKPHGNEIDGVTTCEDDYCQPDTCVIDKPLTPEYISHHEVHERCSECHQMQD